MSAFEVTSEVTVNHAELGAEVWEWGSDEQAAFLTSLAYAFQADPGASLIQLHYIANEIRKSPGGLEAVRWFNDHLTEYLKESTPNG